MAALDIPNQISNGAPNDGDEVQANFDAIEAAVNQRIDSDGSVAMTAPLLLQPNVVEDDGTAAATKDYVDERVGIATGVTTAKRGTVLALGSGSVSNQGFVSTNSVSFSSGTTIVSARIPVDGASYQGEQGPVKLATYDVTPNSFRFAIERDVGSAYAVYLDWVVIGEVA